MVVLGSAGAATATEDSDQDRQVCVPREAWTQTTEWVTESPGEGWRKVDERVVEGTPDVYEYLWKKQVVDKEGTEDVYRKKWYVWTGGPRDDAPAIGEAGWHHPFGNPTPHGAPHDAVEGQVYSSSQGQGQASWFYYENQLVEEGSETTYKWIEEWSVELPGDGWTNTEQSRLKLEGTLDRTEYKFAYDHATVTCEDPEPVPADIQVSFVADCSATNQWRITNGSDQAVDVTINDGQPVNIPAGGQHPFTTGAGVDSVTVAWGGGETGIVGDEAGAEAGDDLSDCGPNIPQKPQGSTSVVSENQVDCFDEEVVTTTTTTVVDHVWNGEVWQRTEHVSTSTEKVAATPGQLNNADCPIPAQPTPDVERAVEKDVDCDDKVVTVTTTITTTPYVWSESTREWVPGEPETETNVDERKPRGNECPQVLPAEGEKPAPANADKPEAPGKPTPENDQVEGVDAERPRPQPVVAGQPEALPTAVDAGLAPVAVASTSSPLGQGLLTGGLVMLVLAGALQAGRRERGAHEV